MDQLKMWSNIETAKKRDLRAKKCAFEYKLYCLISLCFRDLSYLHKGKKLYNYIIKSYNSVSTAVVVPKHFSLCINSSFTSKTFAKITSKSYQLNIFQFYCILMFQKIEAERVLNIYKRSVANYNIQYNLFMSDGDRSSYSAVDKKRLYGAIVSVQEQERFNHAMKRMGTNRQSLTRKYKV